MNEDEMTDEERIKMRARKLLEQARQALGQGDVQAAAGIMDRIEELIG
jgi:hypothetical protein